MTVRPGMWTLIDELRGMTAAGEDDYTIGAVTYWSADQLQTILDKTYSEVDETTHDTTENFDLNLAAALVWERKAAQMVAGGFSWSSDNMRVDKTAMRQEAVNMARYYRGLAGPTSITMTRGDTDAD